jgi:SEC-C motif-containing protein
VNCYCCSGKQFNECCQPLIAGEKAAKNSVELMRSRYSAYCCKKIDYIFQTYHPEQHATNTKTQISEFANTVHFVGLTIINGVEQTDPDTVSFNAHYLLDNKLETLSECSRFVFSGVWYYYDGAITSNKSVGIGRNDDCPCGSGRKFKKCFTHLASGAKLG